MSEPPLLFATGVFLVALGLLLAVLTPWLSLRLDALWRPAGRPSASARHRATRVSARTAA